MTENNIERCSVCGAVLFVACYADDDEGTPIVEGVYTGRECCEFCGGTPDAQGLGNDASGES